MNGKKARSLRKIARFAPSAQREYVNKEYERVVHNGHKPSQYYTVYTQRLDPAGPRHVYQTLKRLVRGI